MPVKAAISRNQLLETRGERHSSYTVVRKIISGGSALTLSYARHANKPVLHIHNSETGHDPLSHQVRQLSDFIESNGIEVRPNKDPRIGKDRPLSSSKEGAGTAGTSSQAKYPQLFVPPDFPKQPEPAILALLCPVNRDRKSKMAKGIPMPNPKREI
jgi:hypothetical protein